MSSKILLKFLGGCLVLLLVFGLTVQNSEAGVSGNTDEPSGQLVVPFVEDAARANFVQVTNTSTDVPVNVHIQIMNGESEVCAECNFFDTLTPADTHVYEIGSLTTNGGGGAPCSVTNGRGIMVVTPTAGLNPDESGAVAHNHLHGVVQTIHDGQLGEFNYLYNAVGRDAVLASGAKAADGIPVDGVAATFSTIIPNSYHIQYTGPDGNSGTFDEVTGQDGSPVFNDVIMVAISDDFGEGSYTPQPGTSPTFAVDVYDDDEVFQSCDEISFSCISVVGINNEHITTLDEDDSVLCGEEGCGVICANETADHQTGYTRLRSIGAGTADVNFGILGHAVTNFGGASHIFVK